ncbi:MAG: HupE/UreJ family protein [Bacteroidetes bacterium]|nr:HupE/UreJ family protein [Bacteroidota bacterium]
MNEVYLGIEHITDLNGYDHMLYLLALVSWASLSDAWRVALLATAFTVGHSITLLLAGLGWVHANGAWIEFLIPVTIAATALVNLRRGAGHKGTPGQWLTYVATVGFGLIHGLGFSSFFRMMQEEGEGIVLPLLRFNLGVELGQLLILAVCLALASLARLVGVTGREQQVFVCAVTGTVAFMMAMERSAQIF